MAREDYIKEYPDEDDEVTIDGTIEVSKDRFEKTALYTAFEDVALTFCHVPLGGSHVATQSYTHALPCGILKIVSYGNTSAALMYQEHQPGGFLYEAVLYHPALTFDPARPSPKDLDRLEVTLNDYLAVEAGTPRFPMIFHDRYPGLAYSNDVLRDTRESVFAVINDGRWGRLKDGRIFVADEARGDRGADRARRAGPSEHEQLVQSTAFSVQSSDRLTRSGKRVKELKFSESEKSVMAKRLGFLARTARHFFPPLHAAISLTHYKNDRLMTHVLSREQIHGVPDAVFEANDPAQLSQYLGETLVLEIDRMESLLSWLFDLYGNIGVTLKDPTLIPRIINACKGDAAYSDILRAAEPAADSQLVIPEHIAVMADRTAKAIYFLNDISRNGFTYHRQNLVHRERVRQQELLEQQRLATTRATDEADQLAEILKNIIKI